MSLSKKLQSPAALILQGFIVGAIVFFAFQPLARAERPADTGTGSVLATLQM